MQRMALRFQVPCGLVIDDWMFQHIDTTVKASKCLLRQFLLNPLLGHFFFSGASHGFHWGTVLQQLTLDVACLRANAAKARSNAETAELSCVGTLGSPLMYYLNRKPYSNTLEHVSDRSMTPSPLAAAWRLWIPADRLFGLIILEKESEVSGWQIGLHHSSCTAMKILATGGDMMYY